MLVPRSPMRCVGGLQRAGDELQGSCSRDGLGIPRRTWDSCGEGRAVCVTAAAGQSPRASLGCCARCWAWCSCQDTPSSEHPLPPTARLLQREDGEVGPQVESRVPRCHSSGGRQRVLWASEQKQEDCEQKQVSSLCAWERWPRAQPAATMMDTEKQGLREKGGDVGVSLTSQGTPAPAEATGGGRGRGAGACRVGGAASVLGSCGRAAWGASACRWGGRTASTDLGLSLSPESVECGLQSVGPRGEGDSGKSSHQRDAPVALLVLWLVTALLHTCHRLEAAAC